MIFIRWPLVGTLRDWMRSAANQHTSVRAERTEAEKLRCEAKETTPGSFDFAQDDADSKLVKVTA